MERRTWAQNLPQPSHASPSPPDGEERVAGVSGEDGLGGGFGFGHDVAESGGETVGVACEHGVVGGDDGCVDVFLDGAFAGLHGFAREDLGDGVRVCGGVEAAFTDFCDGLEEIGGGSVAEGDGGDGDAAVGEALGEFGEALVWGLAVGHADHVFDLGAAVIEHLFGLLHGWVHVGAAACFDGIDGCLDGVFFGGAAEVGDDLWFAVEADDGDLVLRAEEFDGGFGGQAGEGDGEPFHGA